jgi:hypothetical protein
MPGYLNASFSSAASGDVTAIAAVAGQPLKIWRIVLANAVATAQALIFKDGSTALTGAISLPSAVGGLLALDAGANGNPLFTVTAGNAFVVNESAATSVTGFVQYTLG